MTNDLDVLVQGTLMDRTKQPLDRAVLAVAQIEKIVTAEEGLEMGTPLPIPPEWAHKVPVVAEDFGPEPAPAHNHRSSVTELVAETIEGDAGITIFSVPDEERQSKFDRFWGRG